jgi:hypothetical protein
MLKQIKRYILPMFCTIAITGCVSGPKLTQADIPLVHSSLAYSLTPDSESAINIPNANSLSSSSNTVSINYKGLQYQIAKRYVSATGNKCIRFVLQKGEASPTSANNRLTTCQRNGQWRVIAPLVAASSMMSK